MNSSYLSLAMDDFCSLIQRMLGGAFTCKPIGYHVRIRTSYTYPDGDYIDVFVKQCNDDIVISDLGETMRWLIGSGISHRPLDDACKGVEFYHGTLQERCCFDDILKPDIMAINVLKLVEGMFLVMLC
jgi:hypothetical protein